MINIFWGKGGGGMNHYPVTAKFRTILWQDEYQWWLYRILGGGGWVKVWYFPPSVRLLLKADATDLQISVNILIWMQIRFLKNIHRCNYTSTDWDTQTHTQSSCSEVSVQPSDFTSELQLLLLPICCEWSRSSELSLSQKCPPQSFPATPCTVMLTSVFPASVPGKPR